MSATAEVNPKSLEITDVLNCGVARTRSGKEGLVYIPPDMFNIIVH
jgi:hypothetical protein